MSQLFYATDEGRPAPFVDTVYLRELARREVTTSSLIMRAASGDLKAAQAMHRGFWPFTFCFEKAIDDHPLPRDPLHRKFGRRKTQQTFLAAARHVRQMQQEEGQHFAHWAKDAEHFGVSLEYPTDTSSEALRQFVRESIGDVRHLIESAYTDDHVAFFCVLAGTEYIAEELSRFLVGSPAFTALSSRKRWMWGEVHLETHDGPSHLEIDLDLARAYASLSDEDLRPHLEGLIAETIHLFGSAARDVERALAPQPLLVAAE